MPPIASPQAPRPKRTRTLKPRAVAWLLLGLAACASAGGREVFPGVRFYAREAAPAASDPVGRGWQDIPIFVVMAGDFDDGVRGPRALAIRDAMYDARPGRRELFDVVGSTEIHGDTLGAVLWLPPEFASTECVMFGVTPGDSVRPTSFPCTRYETTVRESWRPTALQRTVWEAGGNAVVLVGEEYSGRFRGIRGWVLRCAGPSERTPCR